MKRIVCLGVWLLATAMGMGQMAQEPGLDQADPATLRQMVQELRAAVRELRQQNAQLQMKLSEYEQRAAGESDNVSSESASLPVQHWLVKVLANAQADTSDLQAKLQTLRQQYASGYRLKSDSPAGIDQLIQEQEDELARMASAREYHYVSGEGERTRSRYSSEELGLKRSQIAKLKQQRDQMVRSMRELESQIQEAKTTRRINAVTDEGQSIVVVARGNYLALGQTMEVGKRYRVQGPPIGGGSSIQIHLRLAEPMDQ